MTLYVEVAQVVKKYVPWEILLWKDARRTLPEMLNNHAFLPYGLDIERVKENFAPLSNTIRSTYLKNFSGRRNDRRVNFFKDIDVHKKKLYVNFISEWR